MNIDKILKTFFWETYISPSALEKSKQLIYCIFMRSKILKKLGNIIWTGPQKNLLSHGQWNTVSSSLKWTCFRDSSPLQDFLFGLVQKKIVAWKKSSVRHCFCLNDQKYHKILSLPRVRKKSFINYNLIIIRSQLDYFTFWTLDYSDILIPVYFNLFLIFAWELHSRFSPRHTFAHNHKSESLTTTNMNACLSRNLPCM